MEKIPDKIVFHLDVKTDTTVNHYVDLTRELCVSGDYNVSVPLEFENLYIEYSDTIADLGESLEDIGDKIEARNNGSTTGKWWRLSSAAT